MGVFIQKSYQDLAENRAKRLAHPLVGGKEKMSLFVNGDFFKQQPCLALSVAKMWTKQLQWMFGTVTNTRTQSTGNFLRDWGYSTTLEYVATAFAILGWREWTISMNIQLWRETGVVTVIKKDTVEQVAVSTLKTSSKKACESIPFSSIQETVIPVHVRVPTVERTIEMADSISH